MITITDIIEPTDHTLELDMFNGNKNSLFIVLDEEEINSTEDLKGYTASIIKPNCKTCEYKIIQSKVNKLGIVGLLLDDAKREDIPRLSKVRWSTNA